MITDQEIINQLENRLSSHRFQHSLNVAIVSRKMAEIFGVDPELAYTTGLLHDYAKGISGLDLLTLAEEQGLIEVEMERQVPDLLHAVVGAYLVEKELNIKNPEMLQAIRLHTMGGLQMTDLDKIIFLADMIEPGRDYPGMERLQCLAMRDLDQGMLYGLESTIRYCLDQGRLLHPKTILVRNLFLEKRTKIDC